MSQTEAYFGDLQFLLLGNSRDLLTNMDSHSSFVKYVD